MLQTAGLWGGVVRRGGMRTLMQRYRLAGVARALEIHIPYDDVQLIVAYCYSNRPLTLTADDAVEYLIASHRID